MSICRWSSMDFKCDLYCYESSEGFVTHVAENRVIGNIPGVDTTLLLDFTEENQEIYFKQYKAQMDFLKTANREPIGLKYDGQTFYDDKETLLSRLEMLRAEGYNFPEITEEDLE